MTTIEGRYLLLNDQAAIALGHAQEQIIGKTDADFLPPAIAQPFRANDQQVIASHQPLIREEVVPQAARTFLSNKFPLFDPQGNIYAVAGIATDITQQKQVEEQLRMFEAMVANASVGLVHTTPGRTPRLCPGEVSKRHAQGL